VTETTTAPTLIHSSVLKHVPHAFTTRGGGVSAGPFGSLNFGNPGELSPEQRDPITNIRENYRRVLAAVGAAGRELVEVHQVHGAAVHTVRRGQPSHATPNDTKADAIVTDDPTRMVGVRIADCTPVLLSSADGAVVAAVHAGWRGVIGGVLPAAVRAMRVLAPASCLGGIAGVIGPCISAANFEVGPEVAAEFRRVFGDHAGYVTAGAGDRFHIDLKSALAEQVRAEGITAIEVLPHCTYGQPELFFSHRRATHERAITGRLAAVIGPRS
jgi:YfiH family protein